MLDLRRHLETVKEKALVGENQKVLFRVPPNNKCSGRSSRSCSRTPLPNTSHRNSTGNRSPNRSITSACVMEMFDTPRSPKCRFDFTGDPLHPVEVHPDRTDEYKVGVSPAWRLGKKLLDFYLPMRFPAGGPFHAGTAWHLMDVGLKGMSGVLAR